MNKYRTTSEDEIAKIETFRVDPESEVQQRRSLEQSRAGRDAKTAQAALDCIEEAAAGSENLMPLLIQAARARVTLGEICLVLRKVWGTHDPSQAY